MPAKLERMTGLEPATAGLGSQYSTIELHPQLTQMYTISIDCQVSRKREIFSILKMK